MPHAIVYENTKFDLPGWVAGAFKKYALGYAYRSGDYYMHVYGVDSGTWPLSPGLTASETGANGSTRQWSTRVFGARNIRSMALPAGTVVDGVWRPGLLMYDQRMQALNTNRAEQRAAEQLLYLLVSALSGLFLYIEPEGVGLSAFSPKTRQLLLLACTDAEASWTHYMKRAGVAATGQGYTTRDYVRLRDPLHLAEFRIALTPYSNVPKVRPFDGWNAGAATKSLPWYDAYNKVKHDRTANLNLATLERCIEAVAANVILFSVRFGPFPLYDEMTPLSALVRQLFDLDMVGCDPTTFYVPWADFGTQRRRDLGCGDSREAARPWTVRPLTV